MPLFTIKGTLSIIPKLGTLFSDTKIGAASSINPLAASIRSNVLSRPSDQTLLPATFSSASALAKSAYSVFLSAISISSSLPTFSFISEFSSTASSLLSSFSAFSFSYKNGRSALSIEASRLRVLTPIFSKHFSLNPHLFQVHERFEHCLILL